MAKTAKKKLPQSTPATRAKAKADWAKKNMTGAGPRRDKKLNTALKGAK